MTIFEELPGLEPLHGKTRESDIFEKVKLCLDNLQLDSSELHNVCTAGELAIIDKAVGFATLLEIFLGCLLLKYHCIIYKEALCGKTLNLQHVMLPVIKCVNKITERGLNRRKFRDYCEMLNLGFFRPFSQQ